MGSKYQTVVRKKDGEHTALGLAHSTLAISAHRRVSFAHSYIEIMYSPKTFKLLTRVKSTSHRVHSFYSKLEANTDHDVSLSVEEPRAVGSRKWAQSFKEEVYT